MSSESLTPYFLKDQFSYQGGTDGTKGHIIHVTNEKKSMKGPFTLSKMGETILSNQIHLKNGSVTIYVDNQDRVVEIDIYTPKEENPTRKFILD